jgi:hypothetical protein
MLWSDLIQALQRRQGSEGRSAVTSCRREPVQGYIKLFVLKMQIGYSTHSLPSSLGLFPRIVQFPGLIGEVCSTSVLR